MFTHEQEVTRSYRKVAGQIALELGLPESRGHDLVIALQAHGLIPKNPGVGQGIGGCRAKAIPASDEETAKIRKILEITLPQREAIKRVWGTA